MIIPVGHEKVTVRKIPWVSIGIIALCFLVHLFIIAESKRKSIPFGEKSSQYFIYFFSHPYLEMGEQIKQRFNLEEERLEKFLARKEKKIPPDDPELIRQEQEEFDALEEEFLFAMDELPFRKYGFIPKRRWALNFISYQFVHGG